MDKVQWTDRKEEDNISLYLFASVICFIFSYLTHEVNKTDPSCSALNHLLLHLTGTWFQKSLLFQSFSWDGHELTCIVLHSRCLLWRVSSEMKWVFGPAFLRPLWVSGHSPINVCLIIIANVNTTIQGLCYTAYSLWGCSVYHNKQDLCLTVLKLILATCCFHKATV